MKLAIAVTDNSSPYYVTMQIKYVSNVNQVAGQNLSQGISNESDWGLAFYSGFVDTTV